MTHWAELPNAQTNTTATTLHITLPMEAESADRLTQYQGTSYRYDLLGNLIEKQQHDGEIQHYRYNADNQLTEAEIHKPGESPVQYRYRYDPMGRRIAKVHPDGNEIQYLWDGSRLLQEYRKDRTYTYVYTED